MRLRSTLFLFIACIFSLSAFADRSEVRISKSDMLKSMPSKELVELGLEYLNEKYMPDSALLCLTIVANRRYNKKADQEEIEACAKALNSIGQIYHSEYSNYQKAYAYYYEAEKYALAHNYKKVLASIHNNMVGLEYFNMAIHHDEIQYRELISRQKQIFSEARSYHYDVLGPIATNMASLALTWNFVDSVKQELISFIQDTVPVSMPDSRYQCKAVLAYNDKNYNQALLLLDSALAIVDNKDEKLKSIDSVNIYSMKMEMLRNLNRVEEAYRAQEKSLEISERINYHVGLYSTYEFFYDYYNQKGNQALATKYELLYLREKNQILNQGQLVNLDNIKFLTEIDQMNEEAKAQAAREQMKTYIIWCVCIIALLLMAMLIMLAIKYQQTQEKNRQLYQKTVDLLAIHAEEVRRLEQQVAESKEKAKSRHGNNTLDEHQKEDLLHRVFLIMEKSEEIFSNDFNLQRLAELADTPQVYVSNVINEKYHGNFNALVNEYRIKEACRRLNDTKHYGHLTIEAVATSVGIKSRSNFTAIFKKQTGLSPSEYLRQAQKKSREQ